jgi:tRNA(fMet)-specific endonuclease VapC
MILLDTDTVSLFHAGHSRVVERMEQVDATELVGTTVVTQVEIIRARFEYLLKASSGDELLRAQLWLNRSEALLAELHVARVTPASASEFDRLRRDRKLKKIGRADLLIVSIALSAQATLVTRNVRHFRQIVGLKVENWAD